MILYPILRIFCYKIDYKIRDNPLGVMMLKKDDLKRLGDIPRCQSIHLASFIGFKLGKIEHGSDEISHLRYYREHSRSILSKNFKFFLFVLFVKDIIATTEWYWIILPSFFHFNCSSLDLLLVSRLFALPEVNAGRYLRQRVGHLCCRS